MNFRSLPKSFFLLAILVSTLQAQQHISTVTDGIKAIPDNKLAKDFWFTMIENYEMQNGKTYDLYITPEANTTVNVALGKAAPTKFSLIKGEVLSFRVPLAWEMTSSGVVEDKAIHVWADEELNVQLFSRNPATSDGMTAIPITGWGTEYIVAAFHSYAYLPGYDLPSEFAVVADTDSTLVTITPSTDLRQGISTDVAYPRGVPFTVVLHRGQAIQYKASLAKNDEDYDVTGTSIVATKPVGVVAGVECANVPAANPYCDHICDMITPISRWGKTYYSMPFVNRKGGDGILVIAKEDNTTITRTSKSGTRTHAVLNKYQHYMRHDIDEASKWTSDKSFLLVQYINSTDYPETGANNGIGDPSFTMVPTLDQYSVEHLYQAPTTSASQTSFRNYINIIGPASAASSIRIDGSQELLKLHTTLGSYVMYSAEIVKGSHVITADEPVGVYGYGYGPYDSYAWPGAIGAIPVPDYDLEVPVVTSLTTSCFEAEVHVADPESNKSAELNVVSDTLRNAEISNIAYFGIDNDSASYQLRIVDSAASALAQVSVYDEQGNRLVLRHSYKPGLVDVALGQDVFVVPVGVDTTFDITIKNNSANDIGVLSTGLAGGSNFTLLSSPSGLNVGDSGVISLAYTQTSSLASVDTLLLSDACWNLRVPIRAVSDEDSVSIDVTFMDYGIIRMGENAKQEFAVHNGGKTALKIDSVSIQPAGAFSLVNSPSYPLTIAAGSKRSFELSFAPAGVGAYQATVRIHSGAKSKAITVVGFGTEAASVASEIASVITMYPNPATTTLTLKVKNVPYGDRSSVRILDLAGVEVVGKTTPIASAADDLRFELNISDLPAGAYFTEIDINGEIVRRKFTIAK